jgi:DNA-directed RNA polymerase specialized sigma24 family protein
MNLYLTTNWNEIRSKVRAVTKGHQCTDDLLNDLVLVLLEKPKQYQEDLIEKKKIQHWFTASASIQFKSATSPFWYRYKKFQSDTCEIQDWLHLSEDNEVDIKEEIVEYIRKQLETYNIYERTLCQEHMLNGLSYSEIGREYKINRKYVAETVTPVREELYKKVRELWNY